MKTFITGALFLFLSLPGLAGELRVPLVAKTLSGDTKVNAYRYTNHWGRNEVRLEARGLPRIGGLNPILGYGRDTDDNGTIDTWFMIDQDQGLVRHDLPSAEAWGTDVIEHKLFKLYRTSLKAYFSAAYGSVFSVVLMSVGHGVSSEKELWRELIDLEEFGLRIERSLKSGQLTREQWREAIDLVSTGYTETISRFEKAIGSDYLKLVGADMALWASGGIIVKGILKVAGHLGRPLTSTQAAQKSIAATKKLFGSLRDRARAQLTHFKLLKRAPVNALAASAFRAKFPSTMRALMTKNILMRKLIPTIYRPALALKKATREWKYIAFMASIQLSTEAFANADEVYSPRPTEFAKNVLTHPDIMQNVTYMTTDAYLMTAASLAIKPKGLRYTACGFIALGNSGLTNLVIKGETDYERIALDTGWEAIIGNAQVQMDLKALSHFEAAAQKAKNPKLKLLGWAIVLVDQTAGFLGYSYATQALNERQAAEGMPEVQLVPVLAEH